MELKKRLARELVSQFHSLALARGAEEHFTRVFQRRELPVEIPVLTFRKEATPNGRGAFLVCKADQEERLAVEVIPATPPAYQGDAAALLAAFHLASSRSQAKRLLDQGAVEVDGQRVEGRTITVQDGSVVRVGPRRFLQLKEEN